MTKHPRGKPQQQSADVVLVAGIPGTDVPKAARRIVDVAALQRDGCSATWVVAPKFEDLLLRQHNTSQPEGATLDTIVPLFEFPKPILRRLWHRTLALLKSELDELSEQHSTVLLPIHLTWSHQRLREYIHVLDAPSLVATLSPHRISHVLCLIDDIDDVHERLTSPGRLYDQHADKLSPEDRRRGYLFRRHLEILDWRSREIGESERLAEHAKCPHTVLAVKHPRLSAFFCVAGREQVYLSHPIREPRQLRQSVLEINRTLASSFQSFLWDFQHFLSQQIPLLQPTCIDEYRLCENGDGIGLSRRFYPRSAYVDSLVAATSVPDSKFEVIAPAGDEVELAVARYLGDTARAFVEKQVTSRDLQLVTQSRHLILFRPRFNGTISSGVTEEISYFRQLSEETSRAGGTVLLLDSAFDANRFAPRQLLERLISASAEAEWAIPLRKELAADYLEQLADATCSRIRHVTDAVDDKEMDDLVTTVLRDIGTTEDWCTGEVGVTFPLIRKSTFPDRQERKNAFLRDLRDSLLPFSERPFFADCEMIGVDRLSPGELGTEVLARLRERTAGQDSKV